ncbi:MAG: GMC family oxidoreductase [Pseudomonadota bacterium]
MPQDHKYDFVIVGSGFGGSVSALRLAEKGYDVAVLEAGKRYRTEDFPKTNWNLFKSLWFPLFRCFGTLRITPLSDVLILSGAGVGGGSLGYANTLLEPPDPFFNDPQWADMGDWKAILSPFYRIAKKMLGVTRNQTLYPADELLREVAEEMGRGHTFSLQDVGVFFGEPDKTVPDPYFGGEGPDRTGCNFCGGCMVGCRYNAKNTLDKNYLYLAEKLGVKIFPETRATLIRERSGGGYLVDTVRSTSLFLSPGRQTFPARKVILSAGVLGTLPLLFQCREQGTLRRLSPMLGSRVRTNSETLMGVTAKDDRVDYSRGIAITSSIYPDDVTHVEPVRYSEGSDMMSLLATILVEAKNPWIRRLKWFSRIFTDPVTFFRVLWPFGGWARRSIILLVMQTIDNSVRVYRKRRWWWPFTPSLVSEREDKREKVPVYIPQAQAVAKALAGKIDGIPQSAVNEVLLNTGITAHILGGCPMGPDPDRGVIDGQNRVYGHEGVYVIDGSMIPANLGVNPGLTITAMAEHAMSHVPPKHEA